MKRPICPLACTSVTPERQSHIGALWTHIDTRKLYYNTAPKHLLTKTHENAKPLHIAMIAPLKSGFSERKTTNKARIRQRFAPGHAQAKLQTCHGRIPVFRASVSAHDMIIKEMREWPSAFKFALVEFRSSGGAITHIQSHLVIKHQPTRLLAQVSKRQTVLSNVSNVQPTNAPRASDLR